MGVILFALVCGYLPFEDQNTSNLYKKILAGDYRPPSNISRGAQRAGMPSECCRTTATRQRQPMQS